MNTHEKKGIAAFIAARLLETMMELGIGEAWGDVGAEDVAQVKDEIRAIAATLRESAIYHKSMDVVTRDKRQS